MHFQVINDDYYNKIIRRIQIHIPEFKSVFEEEDGVYPILGELGMFIVDNFAASKLLEGSANFVNEALNEGKSETENAVVLQLFDKIYERPDYDIFRSFLSEKSKDIFDKFLNQ